MFTMVSGDHKVSKTITIKSTRETNRVQEIRNGSIMHKTLPQTRDQSNKF